ncbi:hypothetical protein GCM10011369_18700 [Neiella marina]|uniref:DUF2971 domain-containing protein n=1 Tax=Neiella marina TaxID=508461 RepID=A0A8J2U519_9GAMM|nr:DUF2971 domain-containing protein [Neiella marina]GGA77060.1 hypothetical protein GCM10011369_18700 [Neiella marina]
MLLYKYRGIQSFRFFTDIILKQRLYAAPYFDLNDPMEGRYLYSQSGGSIDQDMKRLLKGEKEKIRICSLSRDPKNELMWSHYAEGHKGVAIGVEVDRNKYEVEPIIYDGLHRVGLHNFHHGSAIDVLSHKLDVWQYEEEERVFVRNNKQYVNVKIREIICGSRMSTQDIGFITELVQKVNPKIEIVNARTNSAYV